jgi:hypothetical protein
MGLVTCHRMAGAWLRFCRGSWRCRDLLHGAHVDLPMSVFLYTRGRNVD